MLKLCRNMPYREPFVFDSFNMNGETFNIFFNRGFGDRVNGELVDNLSHYFIHIYKAYYGEDEVVRPIAYIYFYLDFEKRETRYIGTYVEDKYRNKGLASLLTALWTYISLDNSFYNCTTNKKQRKPFLLYLLKLYGFEIEDIRNYDTNLHTIYICKDNNDNKCLYFKDAGQALSFSDSHNMQKDNYQVISQSTFNSGGIEVLDKIILSIPYYLQDLDKAYTRSRRILDKHNLR